MRPINVKKKWMCFTLKAENSSRRSLMKFGIFSTSFANSVVLEKVFYLTYFWCDCPGLAVFGFW